MPVAFTIEEACQILDPPLTPRQLREIIRAVGLEPTGRRRTGRRGHPHATYDAQQILKLHEVLAPFLVKP